MIEGDGQVRDVALREQRQQRAHEAARGADLMPLRARTRGAAVVRAEQLERAIDDMHLHQRSFRSGENPMLV